VSHVLTSKIDNFVFLHLKNTFLAYFKHAYTHSYNELMILGPLFFLQENVGGTTQEIMTYGLLVLNFGLIAFHK
jgi:hypothetical protein